RREQPADHLVHGHIDERVAKAAQRRSEPINDALTLHCCLDDAGQTASNTALDGVEELNGVVVGGLERLIDFADCSASSGDSGSGPHTTVEQSGDCAACALGVLPHLTDGG